MNENRKKIKSDGKKGLPLILMIIVAVIILALIYYWFILDHGSENNNNADNEKHNLITFTINTNEIMQAENINVNWQLKNTGYNNITYTVPQLGKTLDLYISNENGTIYDYVGIVDTGLPIKKIISSGEVIDGNFSEIFFRIHTDYMGENYSYWQNGTTNEYWFFQPGTYEIYCEYRSFNDIIGTLYSNKATFRIE
jgi:hypothetical protein